MGSNSRLLIPYDTIEDHFQCSICLCVIRGAVFTQCGHRYCTKCITEWVDRNHTCPCCNSPLTATQFYSDVQFDSLINDVLLQRDKAEEAYFDNVIANIGGQNSESVKKSKFEEIFHKHMKSSLLAHQRYFDKLREEHQKKINLLETGQSFGANGIMNADENLEETKANILKNLEESESLAAEAFDRYLTDNVPKLVLLPVKVTVYISDKELRIPDVTIKPNENLSVIKPQIEAAMQGRNDDIVGWNEEEGKRFLFSPLSKCQQYDMNYVTEKFHQLEDVYYLSWDSKPVFQYSMRPGSEIVLAGTFKSQSDMPKRCFVTVFKASERQPVDYFTCSTCTIKWVCKSCIQCCHQGHNVSPFVMGHIPTWACCYCQKKKLCKIQEQ